MVYELGPLSTGISVPYEQDSNKLEMVNKLNQEIQWVNFENLEWVTIFGFHWVGAMTSKFDFGRQILSDVKS